MLTARRRARIEAATAEHLASLERAKPVPFDQARRQLPQVVERQEHAWQTYWRNIVFTGSLGRSAVAR